MTLAELEKEILDIKAKVDLILENQDESLSYRQKLRINNALQGTKVYYVATGPTGVTQTPIKFKDGIFTSETGASGTP